MSLLSLLHYVEHALFSTYIKPRYETNFFLMLNYREQTRLGLTLYSRLYWRQCWSQHWWWDSTEIRHRKKEQLVWGSGLEDTVIIRTKYWKVYGAKTKESRNIFHKWMYTTYQHLHSCPGEHWTHPHTARHFHRCRTRSRCWPQCHRTHLHRSRRSHHQRQKSLEANSCSHQLYMQSKFWVKSH